MEYDHASFVEAVEDLAARAGLEVPREGGAAAPQQPHDELYVALERAALFFRQSLPDEPRARDYLARRGLSAEMIQRFGIGYAPPRWDALLDRYGANEDERQVLLRAGLVIERSADAERGVAPGFYDRFRDRVMFPIRDTRGRTIGFGAGCSTRASRSTSTRRRPSSSTRDANSTGSTRPGRRPAACSASWSSRATWTW